MELVVDLAKKVVAQKQKRCRSGKVVRGRRGQVVNRKVRMKLRKLQRLIPGGQGLQPERLFLQTADYILFLRRQVDVLKALSTLCNP